MMVTSQNRWIVLCGRHGHFRKTPSDSKKEIGSRGSISSTCRTNILGLEGESLSPVPRALLRSTAHLRPINLRPRKPVTSLCPRQFFKIPGSVLFCVLRTLCPFATRHILHWEPVSFVSMLSHTRFRAIFSSPLSTCSGRRPATLSSLDRI
jgi:hypothetical protein